MSTPILITLQSLRHGEFIEELGEELEKALLAMEQVEVGKAATVTATIKIQAKRLVAGAPELLVTATADSKLPKPSVRADHMFSDGKGGMRTTHPRNFDIEDELRKIDKEVDRDTGEIT